ncbi:stalk domain-containing protein [Paenibacillus kobensis]|uniref:stalk domain-containing protein n=1 Tax=Paenibacillus kobensis TaxID=59841 RepID=UPI000FD8863F|nr:stalk domain-containing protein [Paenibacillus kobensis]
MKRHAAKWIMTPMLAAALLLAPAVGATSTVHAAAQAKAVSATAAQPPISVVLDGTKLALGQPPYMVGGTTLVPMKPIFDALGASVTWEQGTKTVIARKGSITVTLQAGAKTAVVNGTNVKLDVPVQVKNGTTFVPVRFISESFSAEVKWNAAKQQIVIRSAEALWQAEQEQMEKERLSSILTTGQNVALNDEKVVMIQTDLGQGSGVIIGDQDILTNYHVMNEAKSANAVTVDGETFEVEGVVASSEQSDLAIIRTKKPLYIDPIDFAWSFDLNKGDPVIAIGSPLGVQNTATEGIVSNFTYEGDVEYIQFSAPTDHGSSGGGLFNQYGELVGITSSGLDDTNTDISFAVSVYNVWDLLDELDANPDAKPAFIKSKLPDTLDNLTSDQLASFMNDNFGSIATSNGQAELSDWNVTVGSDGWIQMESTIDYSFYTIYGERSMPQIGEWALMNGYEVRKRLPNKMVRIIINFDRVVNFEPRGYKPEEVTKTEDGKWRVKFPIVNYQGNAESALLDTR